MKACRNKQTNADKYNSDNPPTPPPPTPFLRAGQKRHNTVATFTVSLLSWAVASRPLHDCSCMPTCSRSVAVKTRSRATRTTIPHRHIPLPITLRTFKRYIFCDLSLKVAISTTNGTARISLFRPMIDAELACTTAAATGPSHFVYTS